MPLRAQGLGAKHSTKHTKHAAQATDGFLILKADSPKQPTDHAEEVYTGAREHELDDMVNNGPLHITHGINVER